MPDLNSAHVCLGAAAAVFSQAARRESSTTVGMFKQVAEVHQTSFNLTYQCAEERKQKTLQTSHEPSNRLPPITGQGNSHWSQSSLLSLSPSFVSVLKKTRKNTEKSSDKVRNSLNNLIWSVSPKVKQFTAGFVVQKLP